MGVAPAPPGQPTLIYDGDCAFCRRWVRRLLGLDGRGRVRAIALQRPEARRLSGQRAEQLRQAVHFVRVDGTVFAGAAALHELARHLRGGSLVRSCARLPGVMPAAEALYRWVAGRWGPLG